MASSVKALLRALGVVPVQAVPDTVDAFLLATGTPHAELLSSLVTEISEMLLKETSIPNDIIEAKGDFLTALLMAILHLFKAAGEGEQAMPKIVWVVCVPLLQKSTVSTAAFHNIVAQMLAEMFISKNAWKYAQVSLVPYLLKPVELILWREQDVTGICQSNDVHTDEIGCLNLIDDERPRICKPLKFYVVCHIVAVLLSQASNHMEIKPLDKKGSCTCAGYTFCIDVILRFFNPMLSVISQTKDDTERKCAIKVLLPPVLKAIQKLNQNMHRGLVESFQRDLWENLKSLFSQGSLQKEDTYFALDLAAEFLMLPFINEQNYVENQVQGFNIWHEIEFWDILKSGLVDDEPLTRKRAVHILRAALSAGFACKSSMSQELTDWKGQKCNPSVSSLTKRDRYADVEARSLGLWDCEVECWKAFFLLYDMLEEYGTHLVEAAWNHQITLLLPTLCGKDIKIESSVDCLQPRGKWHLQDLDASIWWITALWERGFKHDNPQVRRLILQSYMDLDWAKVPKLALAVPKSFVLGPLLSTFNDPIHHKDFGVKGIYSSEMAKAAANFFRLYIKSLETWDCTDFVIKMAGELCSKALCRPGFMTLVMCLEATALSGHFTMSDDYAFSTSMDMIHEKSHCVNVGLDMPDSTKCRAAEILDGLGPLVEDSKKHFNPKYRLKVCYHVLRAASSLVLLPEVPFTKFFWFVGLFPQEFVGLEGMLHKHIWNWLRAVSNKADSFSFFEFQTWMTEGLHEIADAFLKPPRFGVEIIVMDEEVEAWTQEADKWARVVSLGFLEPKNLSRLMMFVHEHASKIYQRAYNSTCVPEKLLLLLDNIIKICPSPLKNSKELTTSGGLPKGMEKQFDFVALTGNSGCSLDGIRKHLQSIVSTNMSELLAHARRASSVFWNYDFSSCGALPSSVIGKLGGPSQRRLPASVASDALKGVIAVGTAADCIAWSWGNLGSEISDSAVLFIWEFVWKSVNVRAAKEEMEGEIQLSLYEALACVCNALASSWSPYVLSLVKQTVPFGETKDERVLDIIVWNLLENINCLLQSGILARSRRAGLLQQKWCCLDGLLSIPRSRVYSIDTSTHSNVPAISDSILKAVLLDAISSLESAGEDNVLPLLRCVRWLMHWNILQRIYAMDPSCESKKGVEVMWSLVRAAWAAVADCNKRRVASIAAFLSAIIHPNVFRESSMHYNNGDDGPLKWLICRLLDQGSRSPRTMRLTAMHVAGLWLEYPAITEYYIEELKLLSLHGGESIDEELDGQISENPVAAREYFTLMQSLDPELVEEFRNSELYVRVTVAVLIHKLAEIVEKAWLSGEPEARLGVESASNCGRKLILKLLNSLANDADLSKELYKKKSAIHRRKTRAWQMTCILSRFVDNDIVKEVVGLLQICLLKNNLPSVRQYAEIFAIQVCLRFPHLVKEKIVSALADYNMKTQALASYVFISVNVLMHATPVSLQNKLIEEVVPAVMPYFTTHHHPLRSFSQILIYEVLHKILKISPDSAEQDKDLPSSLEKKCLQSIVSYLDGNTDCKRIRAAIEKFLNSFDPSTAATPRGIFSIHIGGEEDPSKPLEDIPFECTPIALMDKVSFFLNEAREDLRHSMAADAFALHSEEMSNDKKVLSNHSREEQVTPVPATVKNSKPAGDGPCDFQRKIGSLRFTEISSTDSGERMPENKTIRETFSSLLSVMEREEELLHTTIHSRVEDLSKMRGNRQELIVVATLLGRIPNLAGLARTCEVFKASSLVLADASVTQDRQFQLISVTAEMWVPIKEVPEASLQEYLAGKVMAGYTVVGLEQTANSISLEKYKFPKKTVLVLGKEKEGIPIDIIQNLDACVEIPQLGVIRSLNVHVSGAIAVWEYTRQYLDKP